MNTDRRKQIEEARNILETVKGQIEDAKSILETVKDDEQSAFDNLPEGLQQAERGQAIEENVGYLDEAISNLDSIQ